MPPPLTTGLVCCLDATAITGKVDGDSITTWADSHTSANDATGGSPLYKTNILNGKPVVRFDGVDDTLNVTGIANNVAARTVFLVARQTTLTGSATAAGFGGFARMNVESNQWGYFANSVGAAALFGGVPTDFAIYTLRFNSTSSADGFLNGAAAASFDPDDAYQATGTTLGIGSRSGGNPADPWPGDICEVDVYDSALSDADRASVEVYLGRWLTSSPRPTFNPIPFMR